MIEILARTNGKVIYRYPGSTLVGACLRGLGLFRADFSIRNLWGADLSGANLGEANLWKACLYEARLAGANLSRADLRDADLRYANLGGANLEGADLRNARIDHTTQIGFIDKHGYEVRPGATVSSDHVHIGDWIVAVVGVGTKNDFVHVFKERPDGTRDNMLIPKYRLRETWIQTWSKIKMEKAHEPFTDQNGVEIEPDDYIQGKIGAQKRTVVCRVVARFFATVPGVATRRPGISAVTREGAVVVLYKDMLKQGWSVIEKKNQRSPVSGVVAPAACQHPQIKKVPLGVSGSCDTIWVCMSCKQEV